MTIIFYNCTIIIEIHQLKTAFLSISLGLSALPELQKVTHLTMIEHSNVQDKCIRTTLMECITLGEVDQSYQRNQTKER